MVIVARGKWFAGERCEEERKFLTFLEEPSAEISSIEVDFFQKFFGGLAQLSGGFTTKGITLAHSVPE